MVPWSSFSTARSLNNHSTSQPKNGQSTVLMYNRPMPPLYRRSRPHHIPITTQDTARGITILSFRINPHTHRPIPISPPNPAFIPSKLLLLPHLDPALALLQRLLARPPRRLPMRARDGYENAFLADGDHAEPVDHRHRCHGVLDGYRLADLQHGAQRFRLVGRVLELLDRLAGEVVTRCACGSPNQRKLGSGRLGGGERRGGTSEENDCSGLRASHSVHYCEHIEVVIREGDIAIALRAFVRCDLSIAWDHICHVVCCEQLSREGFA
jgi:hypothetical protein